jgi:hypothetical protein
MHCKVEQADSANFKVFKDPTAPFVKACAHDSSFCRSRSCSAEIGRKTKFWALHLFYNARIQVWQSARQCVTQVFSVTTHGNESPRKNSSKYYIRCVNVPLLSRSKDQALGASIYPSEIN